MTGAEGELARKINEVRHNLGGSRSEDVAGLHFSS